jgi:hypothetical protein
MRKISQVMVPAVEDDRAEIVPVVEEPADGGSAGRVARRSQRGMVSAEWAVGIIAAVAMAGVLFAVVTAGPVQKILLTVVLAQVATFFASEHEALVLTPEDVGTMRAQAADFLKSA